ncbi:MAG: polyketide synthase, partial [Acidobacteria bacterium]|nr:polyketide synthase [Acidobacteriota bacterium]
MTAADHAALMRRALQEIQSLRAELADAKRASQEPIAIVGIGCRFPGGADTPDAYWRLMQNATDAITEVPRSRWDVDTYFDADPDATGKMYTRFGGFLGDIDSFDAQFFGVSPLDAMNMDPQQRLLLEVAWEAFENAGHVPGAVSRTGVYVGSFMDDYLQLDFASATPRQIDAYNTLGLLRGLTAGRLAYVFDLHGPAMQLDTACSSSLLAAHLAVQALRNRECDLALAGGVNLILIPEVTIGLCRMKAMAADGRCTTFDARADGFGRGEGCGIVVLERLSDALARGDRVIAVIRGSAVNHDGRSNGLTAPNGTAQKTVISEALANAGVEASEVDFVEVHGTGTALGDPIEAIALGETLCRGRSAAEPLLVGSVKSNFGHLESAAGAAALIKVALSLERGAIPASLHFETPNPHVPWEQLPLRVVTASTPWPRGERRIAG